MSDNILRLNEFFVEGKDQQKSHVLLHITEPATPEEKAKGYFFAVCEINNATTETIVKLQEIIDEIENSYYEIDDNANQTALEPVLQKVNQYSFSLIKPGVKLSCVLGIIRQNDIVFSFYGSPQMVLFYKNKAGIYQKMDLIQLNAPEADEPTTLQLFPQVIQGKISPNDYLFVGSGNITNYFNLDRLEKIITTRPARQSAEHLEHVLSELKNGWSFGGLIINLQPAPERNIHDKHVSPAKKGGSAKSLHAFFDTEKNTANILSPSLLSHFNEKQKHGRPTDPPVETEETNIRYPQTVISSTHLRQHKTEFRHKDQNVDYREITLQILNFLKTATIGLLRALTWIVLAIWATIVGIARFLGILFFLATNYQNRRALIMDNLRRQWRSYIIYIKQLPLITKILLIVATLTIAIFIVSISYINFSRQRAVALRLFNEGIVTIKNKKDAAESALIYNNEPAAITELQGARDIYNKICDKTKDDNKDCAGIKEQLDNLAVRLRKELVAQPKMLLDINSFNINSKNSQIVKVGNKILAYSTSSEILVQYDTVSKESRTVSTTINVDGFTNAAVPKENDFGLLLYQNKNLARFDAKDGTIKTIEVGYANDKANITALLVYNRRLYTLDPEHNQIYKHDVIKTGYGRGNEWVKDTGIDLSNSIDITIDGDVFVLKNNGEILKFNAGEKQIFSVQGVEPALDSATKIWTYTDLQYLYVLDATNQRLVILYKDGRIKQQITAKEWINPTGMVVDEPNNIAYILDNNKLYQVALK